jgi:hypothetical protein
VLGEEASHGDTEEEGAMSERRGAPFFLFSLRGMQGAKEKALCSFPVAILGEEASTRRHGDTEEEGAVSERRGASFFLKGDARG